MRFERNCGSRSISDNAWPGSEEAGSNGRQVHGTRYFNPADDPENSKKSE